MLKKVKWLALIAGVLFLGIGLFILFNPVANLTALGWLFSCSMLLGGMSEVLGYFSFEAGRRSIWLLLNGIVTILLAFWLLSSSNTDLALLIPTIFAFWVLSASITRLLDGLKLKQTLLGNTKFVNTLVLVGGLGVLFGLILLLNPVFAGALITYVMAGLFIYQGFNSLGVFWRLSSLD